MGSDVAIGAIGLWDLLEDSTEWRGGWGWAQDRGKPMGGWLPLCGVAFPQLCRSIGGGYVAIGCGFVNSR
ncbi:MAG: hypothetical protein ACO4AI_06135 [Prochlorothrix sp.]|nr:hypothetical protein [Prochlorothrix sp.]